MLVNTHILIGQNILSNISDSKRFMISDKNFLYGNIKPDMVSKYKLKKHYLDESFEMIIEKIKYLSRLSIDDISKWFSMSRFSQELGVICHFLCDFFCIPHSERWEFKHSMNKHIKYEKKLSLVAKIFVTNVEYENVFHKDNIETFIVNLHDEYRLKRDYKNDIEFSYYACNTVIEYVFDSIVFNTLNRKIIISA